MIQTEAKAKAERRRVTANHGLYLRIEAEPFALLRRLAKAYNVFPGEQARTVMSWGLDTLEPPQPGDRWRPAPGLSDKPRAEAVARAAEFLRAECPEAEDTHIEAEATHVANAVLRLRIGWNDYE